MEIVFFDAGKLIFTFSEDVQTAERGAVRYRPTKILYALDQKKVTTYHDSRLILSSIASSIQVLREILPVRRFRSASTSFTSDSGTRRLNTRSCSSFSSC